ncbi:MAG: hypothetical protein OEL77_02875 [Nitrosopumilus sp.]|nr:hypothetical protein [Nitrosopumilus sp.]
MLSSPSNAHANHPDMFLCDFFIGTCQTTGIFLWSNDPNDGHTAELICDSQNPNFCKVPYFFGPDITDIQMTLFDIGGEAVKAQNLLNPISTNIGIINSASTSAHDNDIDSMNLGDDVTALYSGIRHCTQTSGSDCIQMDSHLTRVSVRINTDNTVTWGTVETCVNNNPTVYDLEKTFNHEFNHLMGFGHNSDGDSIVFGGGTFTGYVCGQPGYFLTFHDIEEVLEKYSGDWIVSEDYTISQTSPDVVMSIPENIIIENGATLTLESGITLDVDFLGQFILVKNGGSLIVKDGGTVT